MVIRQYEPSDAEALADFFARNLEGVLSAQGVEHAGDAFPARAHLANWVVPQDDGIAGWAYAHLKSAVDLGIGYLRVVVDPAARGGGIGGALWNRAVEHLSALQPRKLTTDVDDFPDSIAFIERRGFQATRRSIVSALDLRSASPPESELPGSLTLSLRRLARLAKSAAMRWSRSNGIESILTNNDAENAPILAINGRLGYQPVKVLIDY